MGRTAIAVVIYCLQPSAFLQIFTGEEASKSIAAAGPPALPYVWSVALIVSAMMWTTSYFLRGEEEKRVAQIAAALQIALGSAIYIASILDTSGLVGTSFLIGMMAALIINCLGFAWFLLKQIRFVRKVAKDLT